MRTRTLYVALLLSLALHGAALAQSPAPIAVVPGAHDQSHVPADHWAYAVLSALRHPGQIVIGSSQGSVPATMSRAEFARAVACELLRASSETPTETRWALQRRTHLRRLAHEFAPELDRLGVKTRAALAHLHSAEWRSSPARVPFADVPQEHWAYSAIERAHKAGILLGYPTPPAFHP